VDFQPVGPVILIFWKCNIEFFAMSSHPHSAIAEESGQVETEECAMFRPLALPLQ